MPNLAANLWPWWCSPRTITNGGRSSPRSADPLAAVQSLEPPLAGYVPGAVCVGGSGADVPVADNEPTDSDIPPKSCDKPLRNLYSGPTCFFTSVGAVDRKPAMSLGGIYP